MTVFDFIEIKKELIATLEGETDDTGALVTDVKYAEGTVRSRKDGDYRKQGGKWVKIYSGEGRGASLAVTHAVKKIKAAQSVDELMDLVNANISRFYDKNGKLLPVVARLRDAVNESKTRINTERKAKEGEKQTQESKTTGEERTENAESEQKTISKSRAEMQKRYAEIMDEKFKILKEFKEELQKFPKFDMSELDRLTIEIKKETKKRKPNNERLNSLNKALEAEKARVEDYYRKYDLYKEKLNSELDKKIATLDSEKIKLKKEMDKTSRFSKKEDAPKTQTLSDEDKKQPSISEIMKFISQNQDKVFDEVEKRKGADSKYQELERVEKEASATKRELEKKFLKDRKEGNSSALKEDKKALKEATENYQKASDASLSYEAELQKQIATQLMTEKPATPAETPTQKPKSRFSIRTPEERAEIARKEALKEYKDKERKRIKSIQNAVDYVKKNYGVDIPDSIITENGRRGFSVKTDSKTLTKQQQKDISRALEEMRVKGILGEHAYNGGLGTFYAFPKKAPIPSELQEKTTSDEDKKKPATPAETPTQKIEKPDFLNGRFNGKVYGNAKYGYRVYVDGKEKSITAEQKKQVDAWQKQESENKMKQMKDEQSTKQGYDNRQTQIDDYIKANGTPDIVKNGFWNGKVYGSEKSGYSVYIDGKKKTLSEADKKQFGL